MAALTQRMLLLILGSLLSIVPDSHALDWTEHANYRTVAVSPAKSNRIGFTELGGAQTGIAFVNHLALETSLTNQVYLNGSGVAIADVDGDDRADLYFCGLESSNRLYRNLGDWRFEPFPNQEIIQCESQASTGAAFADIDGDNDADLLVTGIRSGTRLFINDGKGNFTETTDEAGLRNQYGSTSMALADVNGDGWLDLYVVNYRNETMRDEPDSPFDVKIKDGKYELVTYRGRKGSDPDLKGRFSFDRRAGVMENGEPDQLFLNNGDGTFYRVEWDEGIFMSADGKTMPPLYDWGLSAIFRDLNGDRWPDLYVCNDFQSPDRIWINDGNGSFQPIRETAIRQTSLFSMGVDTADMNRDGLGDIFVADMLSRKHFDRQVQVMDGMAFSQYRSTAGRRPQSPRNTLFQGQENGNYAEIARYAGIDASYWSWSPAFIDVDLDGYEDLLITTGHGRDAQNADVSREIDSIIKASKLSPKKQLELRRRYEKLLVPNVAFRNRGDQTFEEVGTIWGFDSTRISHGIALADLDNDGDQDVVATCLNSPPLILRNESAHPRIRIRLRQDGSNTAGIGAMLKVNAPGLPLQSQEIGAGGRYLSSDDPSRVFALKNATDKATIEVTWRDGTQTKIENVHAYQIVEIDQSLLSPSTSYSDRPDSLATLPLFKDVSPIIPDQHRDEAYDDYAMQPSLPRKLSEAGPGVTWYDFNSDGWEDLFIGAGRGGKMGVFKNTGKGTFIRQRAKAFESAIRRDQTTILAWEPSLKERLLLIGQSNYEDPQPMAKALWQFSVVTGRSDSSVINGPESIGPMALADVDGDSDLDLFVGGSILPRQYPKTATSRLLLNKKGHLTIDETQSSFPSDLDSVRSAVFANLIDDFHPELITAGNWTSIQIHKNTHGKLSQWNPSIQWDDAPNSLPNKPKLQDLTGWWNSVATGDFDGDGQLDIVAGNWGENIAKHSSAMPRRRLYFESKRAPNTGIIESYFNSNLQEWMPLNDWNSVGTSFPSLLKQFSSFKDFGTASIAEISSKGRLNLDYREANVFQSIVLLNRVDHFIVKALPAAVQIGPIFGLGIGDFNLDGNEDILVNQNFYSTKAIGGRQDAGSIHLLQGLGNGTFEATPSSLSGIGANGQGRGLAVCDFNHDGKLDFVSTQNNGPTKVFINQATRRGLSVRLEGPENNRQAVGARIRLLYADNSFGPTHSINIGSGYWSQDATSTVLGFKTPPTAIEITWPKGPIETIPLKEGTKEFKHRFADR